MNRHLILPLLAVAGLGMAAFAGTVLDTRALASSRVAGLHAAAAASSPRTGSPSTHAPKAEKTPEPAESDEPADADAASGGAGAPTAHPCNHGFYVSQAAHAHKGGQYVSSVAKSDLGKNGDCSAPLPAPKTGG